MYACQLNNTLGTGSSFSILNAPTGMVVQAGSGVIQWTPSTAQVGAYKLTVVVSNSSLSNQDTIDLNVVAGAADPAGIYVSSAGDDANPGTATLPFKTIQRAVTNLIPGTTVFVRGGEYRNADFGTDFATRSTNGVAKITASGDAQHWNTLRAFGNEFVHLKSDQNGITLNNVNYWIVDGLEVSGNTQSLTLEDAMQLWWSTDNSRIDGRGIVSNLSQHIVIKNCVIHDFSGAGINDTNSDFMSIENNVVYNNAWWSTSGVQGVANSGLLTTDASTANLEKIVLRGNLVFGNQSLIISHVFSKGFVTLAIDEGNGLHLQNNQKTYQGKALVENNLMLYNGKAGLGLNTIDGVTVRNNSFYQNSRVGDAGELILQLSTASRVENNLFMPRPDRRTIQDPSNAYTNVLANATQASSLDSKLPASVMRLGQVFQNPQTLDFRPATGVPDGMGVPETELNRMFEMVKTYGISVQSPTQVVDTDYLNRMKQLIFSTWVATQNTLTLEDKATGFIYSYAQRCQYPNPPSNTPCP
jgi:hypothetical protein